MYVSAMLPVYDESMNVAGSEGNFYYCMFSMVSVFHYTAHVHFHVLLARDFKNTLYNRRLWTVMLK